ncbi:MAG: BACON domain-containing protein, partial [Bacteroidales bacterium]|nr:BACON domain-containing protein [Bacteroidales bacterium]
MKFKSLFLTACAVVAGLSIASCKKAEEAVGEITVDKTSITLPAEGGTGSVKVVAGMSWNLKGYDSAVQTWLNITPSSGSKGTYDVEIKVLANEGFKRSVTIEFYGDVLHRAPITIEQEGSSEYNTTPISQIILSGNESIVYTIKGTVGGPINTTYGNFDCTDETGTLYVYGCTNWSEYKDKVKVGGEIVLTGKYKFFQSTTGSKNELVDATIIEYKDGEEPITSEVTIKELLEKNTYPSPYKVNNAQIVAFATTTAAKQFVVSDGTGCIYCYYAAGAVGAVGDIFTLDGTVVLYRNNNTKVPEYSDPTCSKTGSAEVKHPTPQEWKGADLDAWTETVCACEYVKIGGLLEADGSYHKITVDGATTLVNPYFDGKDVSEFVGKNVYVTGYVFDLNSGKASIMITDIVADEGSEYISVGSKDVVWDADGVASVNVTVNTNAASWTITNSGEDWLTASKSDNNLVLTPKSANTSTTDPRTATVTLKTPGGKEVSVNCTQKKATEAGVTEIEIDMSAQGFTNAGAVSSITSENITITFDKGTNTSNGPKYYNTGKAVRCYGGNFINIATSKDKITSIDITFSADEEYSNEITADSGTYTAGSWSGSAASVKFT